MRYQIYDTFLIVYFLKNFEGFKISKWKQTFKPEIHKKTISCDFAFVKEIAVNLPIFLEKD